MKSIAWHCGFCDKLYENKPISRVPKWMDEQEKKDYKNGWHFARKYEENTKRS